MVKKKRFGKHKCCTGGSLEVFLLFGLRLYALSVYHLFIIGN
jgi:hypothetical protein